MQKSTANGNTLHPLCSDNTELSFRLLEQNSEYNTSLRTPSAKQFSNEGSLIEISHGRIQWINPCSDKVL